MRLYKRERSPFWWVDVTVKGERYRGSTGETTKRAAKIAVDRIIDRLEQQLKSRGETWTISQAISRWWEEHAKDLKSANSIWSNIENIDRCLDCSIPVDALTSAMLMDYRTKRRSEPAYRGRGHKISRAAAKDPDLSIRLVQPPSINRDLSYLQAALRHVKLMHGQPVPDLPWSKIKFKENEPRVRFASRDEIAALQSCEDQGMADIILAAVSTGLRRGNMHWTWSQIDLRGATVTIPRTKGGVPMIIKLSPQVIDMLRRRRSDAAKASGTVPAPADPVFDWTNYRRRWDRLRRELQLTDFRWHDLRHTFGTWARQAGVDLPTLKEAMAHKDIKTTQRYAHVEADDISGTFDKVAAKLAHSAAHIDTAINENK